MGYFYGIKSGFIYDYEFYPEEKNKSYCNEEDIEYYCIHVKSTGEVPYKFFKGKRLCTSKRPNKNYFDYLKSSVGINDNCQKGLKNCGKLDINRILCIKVEENCPINDIVYNNQSEYINNGITYNTIEINEKEYIHYTNEQKNNYIITNLTVIGKKGEGYPYGSDDNNEIEYITPMDKFPYSKGFPQDFKYFYFKYLSSIQLDDFYRENDLYGIYNLYSDISYYLGRMSLFSTGYFSLSENDIKKLKNLSGLNLNHNYSKSMSKISYTGYVLFIIVGIIIFIGAELSLYYINKKNTMPLMIFQSILLIFLIALILIYTAEIIIKNKIFKISENLPRFLFDDIDEMKKTNAYKRIWIFLGLFAFQIPFFILNIYIIKEKKRKNKYYIAQTKIKEEGLIAEETDDITEDFKASAKSSLDLELFKKA